MVEMKEKIYPELTTIREQPTAPNVINGGSVITGILTG